MSKIARSLTACGATAAVIGGCATTAAAEPAAKTAAARFQGKAVGNSPSGGRVAKKSFPIGAGYGLYFRDNRKSNTPYRLCAVFNGSTRGCVRGRTGRRGTDSIKNSPEIFNPQATGTLDWVWSVRGKRVARWTVTITAGD
jgi:hypothetical protein